MDFHLLRTDASHQDFKGLVKKLDEDLSARDGEEHQFYAQYNVSDHIRYVVIAYEGREALACGAIKAFNAETMEVKRMYCLPSVRGRGLASLILSELENWALELSCNKCMLETGKRQPEAIRLYEKNGYQRIPNYGQYVNVDNSLCFEKDLLSLNPKGDKK